MQDERERRADHLRGGRVEAHQLYAAPPRHRLQVGQREAARVTRLKRRHFTPGVRVTRVY